MNREDLKRPKQADFLGYDNRSNSFLDKDGYIAALEKYLSDLEKHYKELQDALEAAGIGNGTLYKYALNAERGLRIAIGDAMQDVSEWRRFAEEYGEEESGDDYRTCTDDCGCRLLECCWKQDYTGRNCDNRIGHGRDREGNRRRFSV